MTSFRFGRMTFQDHNTDLSSDSNTIEDLEFDLNKSLDSFNEFELINTVVLYDIDEDLPEFELQEVSV